VIETPHRTQIPDIRFPMIEALIARQRTVQILGINRIIYNITIRDP